MSFRLASQAVMARAAEDLSAGRETWFVALGGSMRPTVKLVQRVTLRPVRSDEALVGRVALVKVQGRFWLHRVAQERAGEVYVVGDNGMVNGWAPRAAVFGVLD